VKATDLPSAHLRELAVPLTLNGLHQHEISTSGRGDAAHTGAAGTTARPCAATEYSVVCCTASPLLVHGPMLDGDLELAAYGIPILIYPMPVAGGNAPVTVAGAVTMNIAEFLGVATTIQLTTRARRCSWARGPRSRHEIGPLLVRRPWTLR
jgi:trimethylamine:corrinoid methyltransferase-like protein